MDSPVFNKVRQAAELVALSRKPEDHALSANSVILKGAHDCNVHVDYQPETGSIVLAFVGARSPRRAVTSPTQPACSCREAAFLCAGTSDWDMMTKDRFSGRVAPTWSPNDNVKVHKQLLAGLNSLIQTRGDKPSLMDTIVFKSGVRRGRCADQAACIATHTHTLHACRATFRAASRASGTALAEASRRSQHSGPGARCRRQMCVA
jgi:hypothetical protein